jgi:hypothetical protein
MKTDEKSKVTIYLIIGIPNCVDDVRWDGDDQE